MFIGIFTLTLTILLWALVSGAVIGGMAIFAVGVLAETANAGRLPSARMAIAGTLCALLVLPAIAALVVVLVWAAKPSVDAITGGW